MGAYAAHSKNNTMNTNEEIGEIATKQLKAVHVICAKTASIKPETTVDLYLTKASDEEIVSYEKAGIRIKGYYGAIVTITDANQTIEQHMLREDTATKKLSDIKREAKSAKIVSRKMEFTKFEDIKRDGRKVEFIKYASAE